MEPNQISNKLLNHAKLLERMQSYSAEQVLEALDIYDGRPQSGVVVKREILGNALEIASIARQQLEHAVQSLPLYVQWPGRNETYSIAKMIEDTESQLKQALEKDNE